MLLQVHKGEVAGRGRPGGGQDLVGSPGVAAEKAPALPQVGPEPGPQLGEGMLRPLALGLGDLGLHQRQSGGGAHRRAGRGDEIGGEVAQQGRRASQQTAEGGGHLGRSHEPGVALEIAALLAQGLQAVVGQGLLGAGAQVVHQGLESHGQTHPEKVLAEGHSQGGEHPEQPGEGQGPLAAHQVRQHAAGHLAEEAHHMEHPFRDAHLG